MPTRSPAPVEPMPAVWRDPWALVSALSVLPLLARCIGAPLGEAVAEDFDFLRRTLLAGMGSLLDGGGSTAFWRPLAHQVYYAALGPLIVAHPRAVAAFHVLLLAAGTVLIYRALRPHLGAVAACTAATFPMFAESTRTLVGWPSQFVDVGLYFFSAVALHATAMKRLPLALGATLLALLCKELAVIPALLLPWFPDDRPRATRTRWALAFAALLAIWGAAYLTVRNVAGLHLPHGLENQAALAGTSMMQRLAWAFGGTLRAFASLPLVSVRHEPMAKALAVGFWLTVALALVALPASRARLIARRAWIGWGLAWFAAGTAALASIFPIWQPNRTHFASAGWGIAVGAALESVHPALAGAVVVARGALLFLAPMAPARLTDDPPASGAFMDFARLTRLQLFMVETRTALKSSYPRAPARSHVVEMNLPHGLLYALGGDHAVQVWYRDSTLSMVNFTRVSEDTALSLVAGVQYQPKAATQIVILSPQAMRAQDLGYRLIRRGQWAASLEAIDKADSLAPDPNCEIFHGNNAGYRAFAWLQMHRYAEAEAEARRALTLDKVDRNGMRTLASSLAIQGRLDEALREADHLLRVDPSDASTRALRANIVAARRAQGRK
jgi:tetratricopeptide (TPR) repeat protein